MRKIELKQAGQEAILTVRKCGLASVGKYPEVEFSGPDDRGEPAMIAVNQKSTDRQLTRINLTYQSCVGQTLRFSRSASDDPAKPYWNIDLLGEADGVDQPYTKPAMTSGSSGPPEDDTPHPADRAPQGQPVASSPPQSDDLYLRLTVDTLAKILPLYVKVGVQPTAGEIGAMVATRFIAQTSKRY